MSERRTLLPDGYSFRRLEADEFRPLFVENRPKLFGPAFELPVRDAYSAKESEAIRRLSERLGTPFELRLAVYRDEEFVGWSCGCQESADTFYMINSAVFPEHRNRGVYSALLQQVLEIVKAEGFQVVSSRHVATNNAVLVPKLKAGFVITAFEVSDVFGVLVHLKYFFNPLRRKAVDFRAGLAAPDEELRPLLGLSNTGPESVRDTDG